MSKLQPNQPEVFIKPKLMKSEKKLKKCFLHF